MQVNSLSRSVFFGMETVLEWVGSSIIWQRLNWLMAMVVEG